MNDWREQAIDAGARTVQQPYVYGVTIEESKRIAAAVVDAVEPIIRADERERLSEATWVPREVCESLTRRAVAEEIAQDLLLKADVGDDMWDAAMTTAATIARRIGGAK